MDEWESKKSDVSDVKKNNIKSAISYKREQNVLLTKMLSVCVLRLEHGQAVIYMQPVSVTSQIRKL